MIFYHLILQRLNGFWNASFTFCLRFLVSPKLLSAIYHMRNLYLLLYKPVRIHSYNIWLLVWFINLIIYLLWYSINDLVWLIDHHFTSRLIGSVGFRIAKVREEGSTRGQIPGKIWSGSESQAFGPIITRRGNCPNGSALIIKLFLNSDLFNAGVYCI